MLRFKILASTIPLILAAIYNGGVFTPATRPCITLGETSVRLASNPWQSQAQVSFTDDALLSTVRVQIVDSAEDADFVVVDDSQTSNDGGACPVDAATKLIGITADAATGAPVIYLSRDDGADYRIFVKSASFTARDAAALIVGAHGVPGQGAPARMAAAAL